MFDKPDSFQATMTVQAAVIMSIYKNDNADDLYASVNSILGQDYKDFYLFIAIDGYIDDKLNDFIGAIEHSDPRVFIIRNKYNRGLAWCMNQLIDIIISNYKSVEYIFRMDADDISLNKRLSLQIDFMEKNKEIDVLGGACYEFGIFNKVIRKCEKDSDIKKNIIKITPFIHPTVVFRRRVFDSGIRYPLNTVLSEDLALWLDLTLCDFTFHNLLTPVIYYRLTEATLKRRVGFKKSFSETAERIKFIFKRKKYYLFDLAYILAHLIIRNLPISIIKVVYRILR